MLGELRGAVTAFALVVCGALVLVSANLGLPGEAILQSLRFHIAVVLFGLAILLFMFTAWWRGLLFLVVVGLSVGQGAQIMLRQQQVREASISQGTRPLLKLISFNLLNPNPNGAEIADFLTSSDADVVFLMEATPIDGYLDKLATVFPYGAGCEDVRTCDLVVLSRTPLYDVHVQSMSQIWRNRLVTATTTVDGQRVNLAAVHMVKPYFDEFAYEEAWVLTQAIEAMEGPVLVAGDFNSAAWSDNIDKLVRTVGLAPGPFYPATWPIRLGPLGVPIDNVFARAPLVVYRVESLDDSMGSNHRGLIADISLAGPVEGAVPLSDAQQ